ncbi:hypothetical protein RF11_12882 [Thelohanellus kitauei]|uniref:Uncharacterized protein n=1 Tax=Thelohanellus kitauei TaxID=669202 RepID=A0A0C2IX50_THEKT|nr:hypothetical protein RF11_12882 [Thelohanellus kitauei]
MNNNPNYIVLKFLLHCVHPSQRQGEDLKNAGKPSLAEGCCLKWKKTAKYSPIQNRMCANKILLLYEEKEGKFLNGTRAVVTVPNLRSKNFSYARHSTSTPFSIKSKMSKYKNKRNSIFINIFFLVKSGKRENFSGIIVKDNETFH